MDSTFILTTLNILVAFLGVAFLLFGLFDLAMLYFELSKHDLAEEYLRQAINQDPSSSEDIKAHPKLTLLAAKPGLA